VWEKNEEEDVSSRQDEEGGGIVRKAREGLGTVPRRRPGWRDDDFYNCTVVTGSWAMQCP